MCSAEHSECIRGLALSLGMAPEELNRIGCRLLPLCSLLCSFFPLQDPRG